MDVSADRVRKKSVLLAGGFSDSPDETAYTVAYIEQNSTLSGTLHACRWRTVRPAETMVRVSMIGVCYDVARAERFQHFGSGNVGQSTVYHTR